MIDPTGAGDSFAGGMMGYLTEQDDFDAETLKTAMAYGIVAASFTVEDIQPRPAEEPRATRSTPGSTSVADAQLLNGFSRFVEIQARLRDTVRE